MVSLKHKLEVSEKMKDNEGNSEHFNVYLFLSLPTKNITRKMIRIDQLQVVNL